MQAITRFSSTTVLMPQQDIDTDQIIPARFLTTTTREGLGQHAFADWRYDSAGNARADFVLNTDAAHGCEVLVAGHNFGCGSSREHAPWALLDYGFKAVISSQIADIFRSNSLKNGLVPIVLDTGAHQWLLQHPGAQVTVDLEQRCLQLEDGRQISFPIDDFARYCLMQGVDQLGYLLNLGDAIAAFESGR